MVPVRVPEHGVEWLPNPMTCGGFIDAVSAAAQDPNWCYTAPIPCHTSAIHHYAGLVQHCVVSSGTVLVPSGAVLVTLKPGTESSVLERDIWKEECFLQQSLKGNLEIGIS